MTTAQSTDFLISGGGLVGALLALLLAKRNYTVVLVERKKALPPKENHPLDTRALALNYGTVVLLKNWGFEDLLHNAEYISKIHVSDKGHRGMVHIDASEEQLPFLGAVIPFEDLAFALQEKVLATKQIQFIEGEIQEFKEESLHVDVVLKSSTGKASGSRTKILIGADGAESFIRKALNIQVDEYDYHSSALIGKVRVQKQVADCAFERFTENGPIALLPAGNCLYTMVWVGAPETGNILASLQKAFGYRAGIFVEHGVMKSYPLKRIEAQETYRGRVGLFGNAAHLMHPVSGQGFNLSVHDILTFIEILDMQKTLDVRLWEEYSKRASFQQKMIKTLTHSLVKGFEAQNPLIQKSRNLLLELFEYSSFARSELNNVMIGRF